MRSPTRRGFKLMYSAGNLLVLALLLSSGRTVAAAGSDQAESLDIEQIAQRDLYAVLELEPGAPVADVKAAYRKLARTWHPDKNPQDTQAAQSKFAEIAEAYEVLSDETSRELYDHARRVRAARRHQRNANFNFDDHDGGGGGGEGRRGGLRGNHWNWNAQWYDPYGDDAAFGGDGGFFGSSFDGAGAGAGFHEAFAHGAFGGSGGDVRGGRGESFQYHPRDPIELFEALFGVSGFDLFDEEEDYLYGSQAQRNQQGEEEEEGATAWEAWYQQMGEEHVKHGETTQQQQQQQQQQRQQQERFFEEDRWQGPHHFQHEQPLPADGEEFRFGGQYQGRSQDRSGAAGRDESWIGQDFEQYHDYLSSGHMYRRVITTTVHADGTARSMAQNFIYDTDNRRWLEASIPLEYRGPGVGGTGGNEPVDNVLRMNEFLRVGHSITTVDRKFTATLQRDCNFLVYTFRGRGKNRTRVKMWETGSFDADGHCYATIQNNGMFVIMSGDDPTTAGNVLWSNNRGYVGWFKQNSFHASLLPNGNLVVSQGDSPMSSLATKCLWGAFGCPGEGGVQEWALVWISFRTHANEIWCKVVSHWSGDEDDNVNTDSFEFPRKGAGGDDKEQKYKWHKTTTSDKKSSAEIFESGAATAKTLAEQGASKVKDVFERIMTAAEDTAHAASRPRHW